MAKYDSPGFAGPVPGIGDIDANAYGMTAPGTQGTDSPVPYNDHGTPVGSSPVTGPYQSIHTQMPLPVVTSTTTSTSSAANPMLDKVSGADQTQDVAAGKVWAPRGRRF